MIDGREFITVQRRISDLDNDVVTRKQFKHLWHAASRGEIRNKKSGASSPTFMTLSCGGHAVLKQFIPLMPTSALNCGQMLVPRPEYVRPPTVTSMSLMMAGRRRCVLASRHASACS